MRTWEGIEVEGRLRGVRTLFVGAPGPFDASRWGHVFLNPEHRGEEDGWSSAEALADSGKVVSVAVDSGSPLPPARVLAKVHVLLTFRGDLSPLKGDDTVRVIGPDGAVWCAQARCFERTDPSEYAGDREVEA